HGSCQFSSTCVHGPRVKPGVTGGGDSARTRPVMASVGCDRGAVAVDQGGDAVVKRLVFEDEEHAAAAILAARAFAGEGPLLVHVAEDRVAPGQRHADLAVIAASAAKIDRLALPFARGGDLDRAGGGERGGAAADLGGGGRARDGRVRPPGGGAKRDSAEARGDK